mmetsp:Transcript_1925/g.3932  ORF Transcript_1925/g.3932 Transcript_1925/m.3932 type:complete len:2302 (-) Transcript_1925:37-6942(-)
MDEDNTNNNNKQKEQQDEAPGSPEHTIEFAESDEREMSVTELAAKVSFEEAPEETEDEKPTMEEEEKPAMVEEEKPAMAEEDNQPMVEEKPEEDQFSALATSEETKVEEEYSALTTAEESARLESTPQPGVESAPEPSAATVRFSQRGLFKEPADGVIRAPAIFSASQVNSGSPDKLDLESYRNDPSLAFLGEASKAKMTSNESVAALVIDPSLIGGLTTRSIGVKRSLAKEQSKSYFNVHGPAADGDSSFFREKGKELKASIAQTDSSIPPVEANDQVGKLGGAWRGCVRRLMVSQFSQINGLQMSRILQIFLPFQTGLEALLLYRLIEAFDKNDKEEIQKHLKAAFENRNASRIIMQQLPSRYDWLWHIHTWMSNNRLMDGWGQIPVVGVTGFPATENFPATRNHALASIFRVMLGEGNWVTRVLTGGREGLVTDDPDAVAQNLAAESNNFELANNSQYGTSYGRNKTNEFRFHHRLPTDESLVRTFITSPQATTVNNGVMHVLWSLARHWHNMLRQPWGNFAHQRMEQLDPFETLRFHMPQMLLLVTNLRGRNRWDSEVLGPFIEHLQNLRPSSNAAEPVTPAQTLAIGLREMLPEVCSGVQAWLEPFQSWVDAIITSFDEIQNEAVVVSEILFSVEVGIRVGFDCMLQANWTIPDDEALKTCIVHHVKEIKKSENDYWYRQEQLNEEVPIGCISAALNLTTPRDKRTLIELVASGLEETKPAELLVNRIKTLLQRELRRLALNKVIRERSMGDEITGDLESGEWYWIDDEVYSCIGVVEGTDSYTMMHVASNAESEIDITAKPVLSYNYVAESIDRAQKSYMNIELYHGRTFKYSAFMEFPSLRVALLRLQVVAQMACEELDNARVSVLKEVQRSRARTAVDPEDLEIGKTYYVFDSVTEAYKPFVYTENTKINRRSRILSAKPQSVAVVGGGPTGLMTVLHCTENCLATGGVMKLFEARDAFLKGGSTFERAQIVRLDARWIAMMRYHCGTAFEDVYIPLVGETDSQLGNTLPTQGFVEITIKNLEAMLHGEITRLWSKGLLNIYTESKAQYDPEKNQVIKDGIALKPGDLILRDDGKEHETTWRVADVMYYKVIQMKDLVLGEEYGVWVRELNAIKPFRLTRIDLEGDLRFRSLEDGVPNIEDSSPSVYPIGTPSSAHGKITHVILHSTKVGADTDSTEINVESIEDLKNMKFALDVGYTHIFEAIGKPSASNKHFRITTDEPYGVCCIQGLKVSYQMHNFGETRFGSGIIDDIRSVNDQNTRIIGDFTKMVNVVQYIKEMNHILNTDEDWPKTFMKIVADSKFPELNEWDPIVPKLKKAAEELVADAPTWRRKTVQTRFFETGDNYYLGMEFTREYDQWKSSIAESLVALLRVKDTEGSSTRDIERLKGGLLTLIDKLRYDAVLETIRKGDVYNPGARHRVPRLYLIDSLTPRPLRNLELLEAFRLHENPKELYELILRNGGKQVCRTVEGKIKVLEGGELVRRESNLTRGPDGNAESRVSIAAFPVGHYVNHRSMVPLTKDHVIAMGGDEQSTPHFMRYSGLTGAAINAMSFNVFLGKTLIGVDLETRYSAYSQETSWSNGEVVQRGTGANYGEDGFLRPGFPYRAGVNYLRDKLVEYYETKTPTDTNPLSYDWKVKFAAALIPRGLEHNDDYLNALRQEWHKAVFGRYIDDLKKEQVEEAALNSVIEANENTTNASEFWAAQRGEEGTPGWYCAAIYIVVNVLIDFAQELHSKDLRISSSLFHQLKAVDHIVDDFSVDAQSIANSLTQSSALAASALAFSVVDTDAANIASAILAVLNIFISFGTMTNVARYKTRNEESRIAFYYNDFLHAMQAIFSIMPHSKQSSVAIDNNPFYRELIEKINVIMDQFKYYSVEGEDFKSAFDDLVASSFGNDAIKEFQTKVLTDFVAVKYHQSSYIQESLVDIYDVTNRILAYEQLGGTGAEKAEELFAKLQQFEPRLKASLQEGRIQWGFVKKRKFTQWDICAVISYIRGLFYSNRVERNIGDAPVEVETAYLSQKLHELSTDNGGTMLKREYIGLETCYWAHRESLVASCVFVAASLVFLASILFTIARIGDIGVLIDVAFWTALPSSLGALLATSHLYRKMGILLGLIGKIKDKRKGSKNEKDFKIVTSATRHQIGLTFLRLLAAFSAAFLLPYSLALSFKNDSNNGSAGWIAVASAGSAILSVIYFFGVEYVVRYNLPVDLGPFITRMFEAEIRDAYEKTRRPEELASVQFSPKKEERNHWEYAARLFLHEYRFDAVFAADRFGQIVQTIQGGLPAPSAASEIHNV